MAHDVVIAGGGVMGAAAAFWLCRLSPGLRVCVVEPDPSHARAATALSVASIRQQFSNPLNVRISQFGLEVIRDFAAHLGTEAPDLALRENGYLFLAGTVAAETAMREAAAMQRALGASTVLLSPEAIATRFPWIDPHDVRLGSLGETGEGWFDNMGLLAGFKAAARAAGAVWLRDRVAAVRTEAGRAVGVRLASGDDVSAGAVVLAAGTGVAPLLEALGLPWPVEPRKRTVFVVDAPNARHPQAPLMVDHTGFYLRPEGRHWITATVPRTDAPVAPDDFEPDLHQFEAALWPLLFARVPGFDAARVLRAWAGHYDYNRLDQNAIIGAHPERRGLYLLNGFSGHGLQQAPAMGRGLAELIVTGGYRSLDLAPLGVERLLTGAGFHEAAVV